MGSQRRGEQAEVQVRQGMPDGGRGSSDTGELGVWPEQQVTREDTGVLGQAGARCVGDASDRGSSSP
jgi:hypothetical protein